MWRALVLIPMCVTFGCTERKKERPLENPEVAAYRQRLERHDAECRSKRCDPALELSRICDAYAEVAKRKAKKESDEAIYQPVEALTFELCCEEVIDRLSAIAVLAKSEKYSMMRKGAAEVGVPGWTC